MALTMRLRISCCSWIRSPATRAGRRRVGSRASPAQTALLRVRGPDERANALDDLAGAVAVVEDVVDGLAGLFENLNWDAVNQRAEQARAGAA